MPQKIQKILDLVLTELARAERLHPDWPTDLVHAAGIVAEESGELIRAALRFQYREGGTLEDVRTEAVQTATTAIRLLMNLEGQTMNKKVMDDFHVYETLWKAKCDDCQCDDEDERQDDESVHHPSHYTSHPSGIECIQITEHLNFCLGNAIKYIWRAGMKDDAVTDLEKSRWYLTREIERRKRNA